MTTTDSIWAAAEHLLRRDAAVPLRITAPNFEGETQCLVRWQVETPAGWVGAWNRAALEYLLRAPEAPTAQATPPAVVEPLTSEQLQRLHHIEEFGLFCDYEEFEQIVRAIEFAHGIGIKKGEGNGN